MARPVSATPVDCPVCGTTVSRKSDLGRHMDLHDPSNEKLKHPCPYPGCTYKARQRNNLKTHMNTHTGERPHKCSEVGCGFSTGDPGSLTRHRTRVHGYEPKENSRRCRPATTTRKETRRQRRTAPYPSVASTSTDRSVGSASPLDPSLEVFGTPIPDISCVLDQTASLPPLAGSRVEGRDVKNAFAAYSTELILKHPQVNDSIVAPDIQTQGYLSLRPGLTTRAQVPVDGCSQLRTLEQTQRQGNFSTFDQRILAEPLPEGVLDETTDPLFENFLSQFDHMQGTGTYTLSHIIPPVQYPIYDPPAPLPTPLLPTYEVKPYNMNDTYLPTAATLPAYDNSFAAESAPYDQYGYPTEAMLFDSDAPFSYSFPSATSDMSTYPQGSGFH